MAESSPPNTITKDQILATIYGQATGDAIGLLTEFLDKREAKVYYGKVKKNLELKHKKLCADMHRTNWSEGDWTDDTDQMLLIMLSLIAKNGEIDQVDFAKKLKNWSIRGFPQFGDFGGVGLGRTTKKVLEHPKYPEKAEECAYEVWDANQRNIAPNGGVMRTSILGIHQYWDTEAVAKNADEMCRITHYDPRCRASSIAVCVAISLMLKREPKHVLKNGEFNVPQIIEDSYQMAVKCLEEEEHKTLLKWYMNIEKIKALELAEPGKIGYTFKCMGAGFWALKQKDYRKALQKIVMAGGDSDTNGAVAGALLGCKLGLSSLPESWVNGLKYKDWLDGKIEEFLKLQTRMKTGKASEETSIENPSGNQS